MIKVARTYDICLLDGGNVGRRMFAVHPHACTRRIEDGRKIYTGVAYGYALTVSMLREKFGFSRGVFVCGDRGSKRRKAMYEGYKSNRTSLDEDERKRFIDQQNLASWFLKYANVSEAWCWGEEADDVMATLAAKATAKGQTVLVVSNDHDLLQLVSDTVHVFQTSGEREVVYTPARVKELTGLTPYEHTLRMALTGDPGDVAPGVPGIGDKTADEILRRWPELVESILGLHGPWAGADSLVGIYERGDAPTRVWNLVLKAANDPKTVRLAHDLTRLYTDVQVQYTKTYRDLAKLRDACEKLAFHSLLPREKLEKLMGVRRGED